MLPQVSIIIPVYNKADFVSETLLSIHNQSYENIEVLLINDASTDKSKEIISKWCETHLNFVLINNSKNKGGNYSRNLGIKKASGKYIIFVDADDILINTCVEERVNAIEKAQTDVLISNMGVFRYEIGDINERAYWNVKKRNYLRSFLRHQLPWTIIQPIWNSEILKSSSGFNVRMQRLQDVELHTRLLLKGIKVTLHPNSSPDCFYRIVEGRHDMNRHQLLKKWVDSAFIFINNFKSNPSILERDLLGTSLETISQIIDAKQKNQISSVQSKELFSTLVTAHSISTRKLKLYYHIQSNLPFRIPGLKKATHYYLHGK